MTGSEIGVFSIVVAVCVMGAMQIGYTLGHQYAARFILRRVRLLCETQDQVRLSDIISILKEEAGA